jgi:hypothetical protein
MERRLSQFQWSQPAINHVKNYLQNGAVPPGLSESAERRFKKRCQGFRVENGKLFFDTRVVVPTVDIDSTLKAMHKQAEA